MTASVAWSRCLSSGSVAGLLATAILFATLRPDKGARTETSTRRAATPYSREAEPMSAEDTIKQTVTENDVVLFMKGTKMMPQCGFSSRVAGVLNFMGVEFQDVNVLADDEIRQGIKDYSDWPTIPQLYVKGSSWAAAISSRR
jgi:Grx4 family monothiol glutaredoxin